MNYEMFGVKKEIHISAGLPCMAVLPVKQLYKKMATALMKESSPDLLQYGYASGYPQFRNNLAQFLKRQRNREIDSDQLFITNGATQAVALIISTLSHGHGTAIIERPTYFPFLDMFREFGLNLCFAEVDDEGISVECIRQHLLKAPRPVFIHTIPNFQNPSGVCISELRRKELLTLIENEKDVWLLSDDVYEFLSFGKTPKRSLRTDCKIKNVISIGSFSKIFGPGLRLGWIEADSIVLKNIENSGWVQSSGGMNPIVCRLIQDLLETKETDRVLCIWKKYLAERSANLIKIIKDVFPDASFNVPDGGYYFWVDFKNNLVSDVDFRDYLKKEKNVIYLPGLKCAPHSDKYLSYARIGYATYDNDTIKRGIELLKEGIEQYSKK